MTKKRLVRRLSQEVEMKLLCGGEASARASKAFLSRLQQDPEMARKIGHVMKCGRQSFAAAYPGETRTHVIPNSTLRKRGHGHMADVNELLGLEGT